MRRANSEFARRRRAPVKIRGNRIGGSPFADAKRAAQQSRRKVERGVRMCLVAWPVFGVDSIMERKKQIRCLAIANFKARSGRYYAKLFAQAKLRTKTWRGHETSSSAY